MLHHCNNIQVLTNKCKYQADRGEPVDNRIPSSEPSSNPKKHGGIGRRKFLLDTVYALSFCLTGRPALARGRFCRPVKIGHPFPKNTLYDKWAQDFKKRLLEIDKEIEVEIIPQQSNRAMVDSILSGSNTLCDLAMVYTGTIAIRDPKWHVLLLPALYPNLNAVKGLRHQKDFTNTLEQAIKEKGAFLVTLAWMFYGIATRTVAIKTPDNMKGLKMRVWDGWNKRLFEAAKATPTIMPYPAMISALKVGAIEGTTASIELLSHTGLIKNLTWSSERSIFNSGLALISNRWFWDKTGKDLQPKLIKIGSDSASFFEESYQKAYTNAVETNRKVGVNVIELTQEDFKKWVDLSKKSVWRNFEKEVKEGEKLIWLAQQAQ